MVRVRTIAKNMTFFLGLSLCAGLVGFGDQASPNCKARGSRQWLAQRASPLDSATAVVHGDTAKVCYSRVSARGRTVFGELVPYGRAWRTGANEPTVLHLSCAAEVAGVPLDPGQYILLTVPGLNQWTIAFYRPTSDDPSYKTMSAVGQGVVSSETLTEPVETLTLRGTQGSVSAELILEWERVRVRIPVRAPASRALGDRL
jgi:hypothetical protein